MTQTRSLARRASTMPASSMPSSAFATAGAAVCDRADPRDRRAFARRFARLLPWLLVSALPSMPVFAQRLYVADSGEDKVAIVDVSATPAVVGDIPLAAGSMPRALAISADATTLATGNFNAGSVSLVDLTRSPAVPFATVALGSGNVYAVAFTPDGSKIFVGWSNNLSYITVSGTSATVTGPFAISPTYGVTAIAIAPDGKHLYALTGDTDFGNHVTVVDISGATPTIVGAPTAINGESEKIAVSPDGTLVYATSQSTSSVAILDVSGTSPAVVSTPNVAGPPKGIAISADGHKVYVADNGASAIDVSGPTPAVTDIPITDAGEPYGVALSHDGATLYVTDLVKNTLTTIATGANSVTGSITFGNTLGDVVFAASTPTGTMLSMAPAIVPAGAYSVLTVTLTNPTTTAATISSLHITLDPAIDAYGLVDNSCGGTFANFSANVIGITAGNLPASGSCTLHIQTTANAPGTYTNKVLAGDLQTSVGNNAADASASFTAVTPIAPTLSIAFSPTAIAPGATSMLTVTITNANSTDLELISLMNTLPSGLVIAATPNASTSCPGAAVNATAGSGSFIVTKAAPVLPIATIPAGGGCTASVAVTAAAVGSYVDVLPAGAVQAYTIALSLPEIAGGNVADNSAAAASATLRVSAPVAPAPMSGVATLLLMAGLLAVLAHTHSVRSQRIDAGAQTRKDDRRLRAASAPANARRGKDQPEAGQARRR